jgi:hypothetical protein
MRCLIVDDSQEFLTSAAQLLGSQGVDLVQPGGRVPAEARPWRRGDRASSRLRSLEVGEDGEHASMVALAHG